jgi:hypothetical protein
MKQQQRLVTQFFGEFDKKEQCLAQLGSVKEALDLSSHSVLTLCADKFSLGKQFEIYHSWMDPYEPGKVTFGYDLWEDPKKYATVESCLATKAEKETFYKEVLKKNVAGSFCSVKKKEFFTLLFGRKLPPA